MNRMIKFRMWNPHRNNGKGEYQPDIENVMLCLTYQSLVGTDHPMAYDYISEGYAFEQYLFTDIHGEEVFVGSICRDKLVPENVFEIVFEDFEYSGKGNTNQDRSLFDLYIRSRIEVIGNIHEQ